MEKTILVDAWNTFVTAEGVNEELHEMLEEFSARKIILTNANEKEMEKYGIKDMPYEVFTLMHNPDKKEPAYYLRMLEHFGLEADDALYLEHNEMAVKSARSVGINTFHYDKDTKDVKSVRQFLEENL